MGNRKAIWSSTVGRQRAPFLSRACRKMPIVTKNGLAKINTLSKGQGVQEQPGATMKRKTWLESRHHQSCCSALLNSCEDVLVDILPLGAPVTAGDGTLFNLFWEAGDWWEATLSPWLLSNLADDEEHSLTRSWLNFSSSFILMP